MSDLTQNMPAVKAEVGMRLIVPDVTLKSAVQMYERSALFRDPADSGLLKVSPAGNPMYDAYGVAMVNQLGDGLRAALLDVGLFERTNSAGGDAIPAYLPLGWPVYAADNQTVALTNGGGTRPQLGWHGGFSKSGVPLVWIGYCPYVRTELLIPVVIGHADLTAAATTQAFTLYTLPGPARVMHPPCNDTLTDFSGGGTGSATLQIGAAADPDAIGAAKDIFTGADPGVYTAGVLGYPGALLAAGTAITATVTADTTVAAYTAGAVVAHLRLRPGS